MVIKSYTSCLSPEGCALLVILKPANLVFESVCTITSLYPCSSFREYEPNYKKGLSLAPPRTPGNSRPKWWFRSDVRMEWSEIEYQNSRRHWKKKFLLLGPSSYVSSRNNQTFITDSSIKTGRWWIHQSGTQIQVQDYAKKEKLQEEKVSF